MDAEEKKILVFINSMDHQGHGADFRSALRTALRPIPFGIFDDLKKTPENIFSATVHGILMSTAVILDKGGGLDGTTPADALIQYGICYALGKKCVLVSVRDALPIEALQSNDSLVEGVVRFDCYLDFATQFEKDFLSWYESVNPFISVQPNKLAVHSFVVIGVNRWRDPDLYEIVSDFSMVKGWKSRVYMDLRSLSKLESLAKAVAKRSFCLFCSSDTNVEEFYIGIGIAIGLGRPFLILKHKNNKLPASLSGYLGVIEYESYSQLKVQLDAYRERFLSDKVFEWEGATYNDFLSRLEKQVDRLNPKTYDSYEAALITINSVLGDLLAKPFALLGEIYREKNRKVSPDNVQLLQTAKVYYEKALSIQKDYQLYQNAVSAIDKHIQLIELIKEKKYRSIPVLINLIGGEIKDYHYTQIKEYLLSVVTKLVEEKDYVHAISLLAAMQTHDKSDQIKSLIKQVVNSAPQEIILALQESQKYVVELIDEKTRIGLQIREKEAQLALSTEQLEAIKDQLTKSQQNLGQIQKEYNELNEKMLDISSQLNALNTSKHELETEIESFGELGGRGVVVDFGDGWAVYRRLQNMPYVIRGGERLSARKGLVLLSGDILYDERGIPLEEFLPPETIVIKPNDDLYYEILNRGK